MTRPKKEIPTGDFVFASFHGSGLRKDSLADFLHKLDSTAHVNAFQGTIKNGAGFNFWNRGSDGRIDPTTILAGARNFAERHTAQLRQCPQRPVIAIGYSSGAIFAQALIAVAPKTFDGAILMRTAPISSNFMFPDLFQMPVIVISGIADPRRRSDDGDRVALQMEKAGAIVQRTALNCGHGWADGDADLIAAKTWLNATLLERLR